MKTVRCFRNASDAIETFDEEVAKTWVADGKVVFIVDVETGAFNDIL